MRRRIIYIAGPYTNPDPVENTHNAIKVWEQLWLAGFVPICPHASLVLQLVCPRPYQEWLDYDLELLRTCDALYRMPGESNGANLEVTEAIRLGMSVYCNLSLLLGLPNTVPDGLPEWAKMLGW